MTRFNLDKQSEKVFDALQGTNDQFSGFVDRARRHLGALESELQVARYPGLHLPDLLRPLCGQVTAEQITWCHDEVFILGNGPWTRNDIQAFLEDIGFVITDELSAETTVLIGSEELRASDIQPLIDFACEQELQIVPQELFVLGLIRREDPFELLNEEQIESIAGSHMGIGALREHEVTWPVSISTGDPSYRPPVQLIDDGSSHSETGPIDTSDWNDRSVLGNIGYSVRDGLLTGQQRRTYLETALTHDLSEVASSGELQKWSAPGTTGRLQALVSFVHWLNRTQSADKPAARQKRLEDLQWLRDRYDPNQKRIHWPELHHKSVAARKRVPNAAFMKALRPSPELAAIVGSAPLPRTEVVSKLWEYIKRNRLQDRVNKRMVNADDKLRAIFGKNHVSMFEMAGLIGKHVR